jgi:hypothetical protein
LSFGGVLKSIGKALSRLPWKDIGKATAQLTFMAGKVYLNSKKSRLTNISPLERGVSLNRMDERVLKMMEGQNARIQEIELGVLEQQSYDSEQAKVIADIADQMTTLANVMQTLSVRLNIAIALAVVALGMSLLVLILKLLR